MKWYLIIWTFGLIVVALTMRLALELAMLGRSWS